MYQELGVPVSLTWEVYGDQTAAFLDCFRMFNPLTAPALNQTVQSWTAAFFAMLTLLPGHPQVAAEVAGLPAPAGMPAAVQQPQQQQSGTQQQQQQPAQTQPTTGQQQQEQPAAHPAVQQGAQQQDEAQLRNGSSVDEHGSAQQQISELAAAARDHTDSGGGGGGAQQPDAAASRSSLRTGLWGVRRPARTRAPEVLFMLAFALAGVLLLQGVACCGGAASPAWPAHVAAAVAASAQLGLPHTRAPDATQASSWAPCCGASSRGCATP